LRAFRTLAAEPALHGGGLVLQLPMAALISKAPGRALDGAAWRCTLKRLKAVRLALIAGLRGPFGRDRHEPSQVIAILIGN